VTREQRENSLGSVTSARPRRPGRLFTAERILVDLVALAFLVRAAILAFTGDFDPQVVLGVALALILVEAQSLRS
jgi:hypothetical protein